MANHNGYLHEEITIATPLLVVAEQMRRAREELTDLLNNGHRQFAEIDRKLAEFKSYVRAVDVLSGHVDVKGNPLNTGNGAIIDETTYDETERLARQPPKDESRSSKAGLAAIAAAVSGDTEGEQAA